MVTNTPTSQNDWIWLHNEYHIIQDMITIYIGILYHFDSISLSQQHLCVCATALCVYAWCLAAVKWFPNLKQQYDQLML